MRFLFTIMLIPAFLAGGSTAAAGEDHLLRADITYGKESYTQFLRLPRGTKADYSGTVKSSAGTEKRVILNGLLTEGGKEPVLQYQFELSGLHGESRSVQAQGEVALTPGEPLPALECGSWSLVLTLDPPKTGEAKNSGKAWNGGSLSNYRLTSSLSAGKSRQTCRIISRLGAQSSAVDSVKKDEKKYGFTLNSLFSQDGIKQEFRLQYQMDFNSVETAGSIALQNEISLPLNKKTRVPGEGYTLELLLEGQGPQKVRPAGSATPDPREDRCFCVQYTGKIPPYTLARLNFLPGCENIKLNTESVSARDLLACEELRKCLNGPNPDECIYKAKEERNKNLP